MSKGEKMRFKLIAAMLIAASSLTAAPQAVDKFNELRNAVENWTRLNMLSGVLTVSAREKKSAEQASEKKSAERALFEPRAQFAEPRAAQTSEAQRVAGDEEFRWNGRLSAGNTVEIKGINGDIRAEPATGSEVEVVANKHARRSNPSEVQIKVIEHEGGVTICAVYPTGEAGRMNDCTVGRNWSSHTHDNDVQVDFTVRVPSGLRFEGRTVNGGVETGAINGDVEATTVNGSINVSATGYAEARTINGSIKATMGKADWPHDLDFETVNGGITLTLPEATSATVDAQTLNGDISTDFPMTIQGRFSRRRLNGTIADGKHQLMLKTVNGSINLRRGQ